MRGRETGEINNDFFLKFCHCFNNKQLIDLFCFHSFISDSFVVKSFKKKMIFFICEFDYLSNNLQNQEPTKTKITTHQMHSRQLTKLIN